MSYAGMEFLAILTQALPSLLGGAVCLSDFITQQSWSYWELVSGHLLHISNSDFSCLGEAALILHEPLLPISFLLLV